MVKKIVSLFILFFFLTIGLSVSAVLDEESQYDLSVEGISLNLSYPVYNQEAVITVSIKNNGQTNLVTNNGFNIAYNFSDFSLKNMTSPSLSLSNYLSPGGAVDYTFTGSFTSAGDKALTFSIDAQDQLNETSETNNSLSKTVSVKAPADTDLSIDSITFDKTSLLLGDPLKITFNVKNSGQTTLVNALGLATNDISATFTNFSFAKSSADASPGVENPLDPGEIFKYVYEGNFNQSGANTITFKINKNKELIESDYNNNATSTVFTIYLNQKAADGFSVLKKELTLTGSTTAELNWTTDKNTNFSLTYQQVGYLSTKKTVADNGKAEHKINLSGLTPGAAYEYSISLINGLAEEYSGLKYFTMPPSDDFLNASPAVDTSPSASTDGSATDSPAQTAPTGQDAVAPAASEKSIKNISLYNILIGKIILQVESKGEAYYIHPLKRTRYYLGRPDDAFRVMREQGIGITNADLAKIPAALTNLTGPDTDGDGLSDLFEDAIGTDKNKDDTDGDGHNDKDELLTGYSPTVRDAKLSLSSSFTDSQKGKIFLQIQAHGEAWYINPTDGKRYFLGRPADAFSVMRNLGLGISNKDFNSL